MFIVKAIFFILGLWKIADLLIVGESNRRRKEIIYVNDDVK